MSTATTNSFDITNLSFFALIGILVKLFLGGSTSASGLSGPASASVWGYGLCAIAVLGMMIVTFGLTTKMTNVSKYNTLGFVGALLGHSLPAILTLAVLTWLITINGAYYKRINEGKVASEFNTYSTGSTILVVSQIVALVVFMRDQLTADIARTAEGKQISEALGSRLASVTYLLTVINFMFAGVQTIILKYFSTDG